MKLSAKQADNLIDVVRAFTGKQVMIFEAVKYGSTITASQFMLVAKDVSASVHNAQLTLSDLDQTYYGIALDSVTRFEIGEYDTVEIIEQLGSDVQRSTRIRAAI